jgi:predicted  nucleic acid-binding Zn-ribbon protein
MKLNDHVYSEVIRSEEIQNCPHCGRILYLEPNSEEGEESS